MGLREQIQAAAAFDEERYQTLQEMIDGSTDRCEGAQTENAHLQPLIEQLASVAQAAAQVPDAEHGKLRDALDALRALVQPGVGS